MAWDVAFDYHLLYLGYPSSLINTARVRPWIPLSSTTWHFFRVVPLFARPFHRSCVSAPQLPQPAVQTSRDPDPEV